MGHTIQFIPSNGGGAEKAAGQTQLLINRPVISRQRKRAVSNKLTSLWF
jgi:hypothetical protein